VTEHSISEEERAKARRRRWFVRLPVALVLLALAAPILYAVAINVFLSTSLFERVVDGKPQTIDIHYRRGWSWVPGHIHAKDLSIRGRDGSVEWVLRLDDVEFDVHFAAFTRRGFEADHVHGRGITFRLRQRLASPPSSPDEVSDLPPIDGLPPYSMKPPPEPDPGYYDDSQYRLWHAHLEDIVADDVREIWIDHARFEGNMRIGGRFDFHPQRRVDIGPVRIDVREGSVRSGVGVLADKLAGAAVRVTERPFDARVAHGMDIVRAFDVSADLSAVCPDVAHIPITWPAGVTVAGAVDIHRLGVELRAGRLEAGTRIDAELPSAVGSRGEHRFVGSLVVQGAVAADAAGSRLDFHAELGGVDIAREAAPTRGGPRPSGVFLHVPRVAVTGDGRALDLVDLLSDLHLLVDVPDGELPDVQALSEFVPATTPLILRHGRGHVAAHLETWRAEQRAAGHAHLGVDGLDMTLARMRMSGRASADASIGSFPWSTSHITDARLSFGIETGAVAAERAPGTPLVRITDLRIDSRASDLDVTHPLHAVRARIVLGAGDIVDPNLLRAYLPGGPDMTILPGRARIRFLSELAVNDHLARGTLDVASTGLGVAFRDFQAAADVHAVADVHAWQWERGVLALDRARVDVTGITVYRKDGANVPGGGGVPCTGGSPRPACLALTFDRIALGAKSRRFDVVDPLFDVALSATLADAKVHDPEIVNAFLPSGAPFGFVAEDGGFSAGVDAEVHQHVLSGTLVVEATRMGLGGKDIRLGGDVDALAHVAAWDFARHTMSVRDAHLAFTHVTGRFRPRGAGDDPSSGGVRPDFRAKRVELWASMPDFDLLAPSLHSVQGHLAIREAELPDARTLQPFIPSRPVFVLESGEARVSGDLAISPAGTAPRGALDVALDHAGFAFRQTHFAGDFDVALRLGSYRPDPTRFDIAGTRLLMRDVQITNASTDTSRWRGDVAFEAGTFRLDPQPELDGDIRLEARDASPILAILLGNGLPKFLAGLASMPHLTGIAHLTMAPQRVAIHDLDARGGDLSLEGLYVVARGHRAGAFIASKGPFSAGFHLDDQGVGLRFFGLQGWLRDQTANDLRLLGPDPADDPPPPRPSE
jgi:hypothetical protein